MLNPFHVQIDATVDYCQEHLENAVKLTTDPRLEARFEGLDVFKVFRLAGELLRNLDELLVGGTQNLDITEWRLKELRSEIRDCAGRSCDCKYIAVTHAIQVLDRQLRSNSDRWVVVNDGPHGANAAGTLMLDTLHEQVCHLNQSAWRDQKVSWDHVEVLCDGEQIVAEFTLGDEAAAVYVQLLDGPYADASFCARPNGALADSELVFLDRALVTVAVELYQNSPMTARPDFIEGLNRLQENGFTDLPAPYREAGATIASAYGDSPGELAAMVNDLGETDAQRGWVMSAADAVVVLVTSLDERTVETINTLAPNWAGMPSDLLDVARASTSV